MGRRRGLIGTLLWATREMERAHRRYEREARREQRHLEEEHRRLEQQKSRLVALAAYEAAREAAAQEAARIQYEVAVYDNTLARLSSIHRESGPTIDWKGLADAPPPVPPSIARSETSRLETVLAEFRPKWWERLFSVTKRRDAVVAALGASRSTDIMHEREAAKEHAKALERWTQAKEMASDVLSGDLETYVDVLEDTQCLRELAELGSPGRVTFKSRSFATFTILVDESSIVPMEEKSISARGKLLAKKISASRRQEIHQDYVCGALLRGARELLAALPLSAVLAHAEMDMLDTSSGHAESRTVVSAFCPRETLESINWDTVDASDLISKLRHAMVFKRGKGFVAVEALASSDFVNIEHPAIN